MGAGLVVAYLIGLAGALLLIGLGWWTAGAGWERAMLRWVQGTTSPTLDLVMLTLPLFGTNYTLIPLVALAALWLWRPPGRVGALLIALLGSIVCAGAVQAVGLFVLGRGFDRALLSTLAVLGAAAAYAADRRHAERSRRPVVAMHLVVVQLGSLCLNMGLKFSILRDRPALFEPRGQHAFSAYPSGHSIAATSVAFTVAWLIHRSGHGTWGYWLAAAFFVLNSWSRVYLGVHWPTDVIGGTAVGLAWLLACVWAFAPAHGRAFEGASMASSDRD